MSIAKPDVKPVWANAAAGGDIAEPTALEGSGWTAASNAPRYDHVNWLVKRAISLGTYLMARGIPDYSNTETYSVGDVVQAGQIVYMCAIAGTGIPCVAPYFLPFGVGWLEAALAPGLAAILPNSIYSAIGTLLGIQTPPSPLGGVPRGTLRVGPLQISWSTFTFSFVGGLPQAHTIYWDYAFFNCFGAIASSDAGLITSAIASATQAVVNALVPSGVSAPSSANGFVVGIGLRVFP